MNTNHDIPTGHLEHSWLESIGFIWSPNIRKWQYDSGLSVGVDEVYSGWIITQTSDENGESIFSYERHARFSGVVKALKPYADFVGVELPKWA